MIVFLNAPRIIPATNENSINKNDAPRVASLEVARIKRLLKYLEMYLKEKTVKKPGNR